MEGAGPRAISSGSDGVSRDTAPTIALIISTPHNLQISISEAMTARKSERSKSGVAPPLGSLGQALLPEGEGFSYATPSLRCRLVDDVVYWKVSFLSG